MKRALCIPALALLLLLSACADVPAPTAEPTASPTANPLSGPAVRTDWSQLGERQALPEPVGGRWYEDYTDTLICREDYGSLIPYAGYRLYGDMFFADGCMYGLMTADGKAVTDPVFESIYKAGYYMDGERYIFPVLILSKRDPTLQEKGMENSAVSAVAAADGSWCTGFAYCRVRSSKDGLLLFTENDMSFMSPTGKILKTWTPAEMGITRKKYKELLSGTVNGIDVDWLDGCILIDYREDDYTALLFNVAQSTTCTMPISEYQELLDEDYNNLFKSSASDWDIEVGEKETFAVRAGEQYVIPYSAPGKEPQVYGEMIAFPDGALYTLEGEELLPAFEKRGFYWVSDSLLGSEAPGILEVYEYGEGNYNKHFRADGSPIPMMDGWIICAGLDDAHRYRQCSLVGGLIECVDLNTAAYYDLETLECVFLTYLFFNGD